MLLSRQSFANDLLRAMNICSIRLITLSNINMSAYLFNQNESRTHKKDAVEKLALAVS